MVGKQLTRANTYPLGNIAAVDFGPRRYTAGHFSNRWVYTERLLETSMQKWESIRLYRPEGYLDPAGKLGPDLSDDGFLKGAVPRKPQLESKGG